MPSTNQTQHLSLNLWEGSDKPKMEDFNADNRALDLALGGHLAAEALHLLEGDRTRWENGMPVIGSYTGDGQEMRALDLGFLPSFGVIFAVDKNIVQSMGVGGDTMAFSAIISQQGCSLGAFIEDNVLYVQNTSGAYLNNVPQLNSTNVVYVYLIFR